MSRQRRHAWGAIVAVAILVPLGACGADSPAPTAPGDPTPSADRTAPSSASPTPSQPAKDAHAACSLVGDGGDDSVLLRIPKAILAIEDRLGGEELAELTRINDVLAEAVAIAPADLAAALTAVKVPFQQVAEVVEAGGGQLSMDTASLPEDIMEVMELCVDAGYTTDDEPA